MPITTRTVTVYTCDRCGYCINAFRRFMHGDPTPGIEKEN